MVIKDCQTITDHRDKPILLRYHDGSEYLEFSNKSELFDYIPENWMVVEILTYEILDSCIIITIPQPFSFVKGSDNKWQKNKS